MGSNLTATYCFVVLFEATKKFSSANLAYLGIFHRMSPLRFFDLACNFWQTLKPFIKFSLDNIIN